MKHILRLAVCLVFGVSVFAQQTAAPKSAAKPAVKKTPPAPKAPDTLVFRSALELRIEGRGFQDTLLPYDRFPARAQGKVPSAVWSLSRNSAGIAVRFVTDAPEIWAKWNLASEKLALPHMAGVGVSGLDLYARDPRGHWRWVGIGKPNAQSNVEKLTSVGFEGARREYMLYLPLYNGTVSLEIGVPKGYAVEPGPARPADRAKPIVFYGTSITHGASANRPGMCHPAIIGRRLDRPVINLGFSGNGKMDASVGQLLAELDPVVYVIDCCPNMDDKLITERTEPLVRQLRAARPHTPILLVEDRNYADDWVNPVKARKNADNHVALKAAYDRLLAAGVTGLSYLSAGELLGDDDEATADSSHPSDLGFWRQAAAFERILRTIIK